MKVLLSITRYSSGKDQKRLTMKGLLHTYSMIVIGKEKYIHILQVHWDFLQGV